MRHWLRAMVIGASVMGVVGCYHDKPHEYGRERPPVDELDSRDKGLQSKDVVAASDQMAHDLLSKVPELNQSGHRWLIVVDSVENHTRDNSFDLNIFLSRLRVNLNKYGHSQIQLIENRDKLRELQSKELEPTAGGDTYGQGSGGKPAPGSAGIQPDYSLYAKITEMPNRGTSYFYCEFTLTNLHTRELEWTDGYEVKVDR